MRPTTAIATLLLALTACGDGSAGVEGSTTAPGTTGTGTEPTTAPAEPLSCEEYCGLVTTHCTEVSEAPRVTNAQYFEGADAGMASCMLACAAFPVGVRDERSGNTLGCRTYHAEAAAGDPTVQCPHAGPGGAGRCGNNCDGFCAIAVELCSVTYADAAPCVLACNNFMDTVRYDTSQAAGNSLACRLYHLTAAALDPTTHCPHITPESSVCT